MQHWNTRRWLVMGLLLFQATAAWSYTQEEAVQARDKNDYKLLKKITDDDSTDKEVRAYALRGLEREVRVTYLDAPWIISMPAQRIFLFLGAAQYSNLPSERYPDAFQVLGDTLKIRASYVFIQTLQRAYVNRLGVEGKWDMALAESKRLIGLSRPDGNYPKWAIDTISVTIKNENFARTKDAVSSARAMQEFLDDVKNGTQKSKWFDIPFPGATPNTKNVALLEKSDIAQMRVWALLYAGKYEAARREADAIYAKANNSGAVKSALLLVAQCINGKAQRVDAANDLLTPNE